MLRWSLLAFGLLLVALGSLTVVRSPDWSPSWKLALLAGEYGHFLALLPCALALLAWFTRGSSPAGAVGTALLCAVAIVLFLRPIFTAWRLSADLPPALTAAFGPGASDRAPFSVTELFSSAPVPVPVETLPFAAGLALDFYRATRPDGRAAPCVLMIHGGGWDGGSRTEIAHFNHWLARRGYAVAAVDYRLAPQHPWPAQRDDIVAALAFLQARAGPLGVDPTRCVLLGRSAGGHLAEAVAYTTADPSIRGVIALYAPADLHFAYAYSREDDVLKSPQLLRQFLGGPPDTARPAYDSASGYLHVNPTTPPTLLLHGQLDTLVWHRQSERLAARLAEHRVPHAFLSLPWATHAFEFNLAGPGGQLARYSIERFLASVTR